MGNRLAGKFIHITGSLSVEVDEESIGLARALVSSLAREVLLEEGGLVVLINSGQPNSAIPFDWDILRVASEFQATYRTGRCLVRTVRHPDWRQVLTPDQRLVLSELSDHIEDHPPLHWVGGRIRETQAEMSDAAITIGGGVGVEDTASRLQEMRKPVLPLNFHIPDQPAYTGASKLYSDSIRDPQAFMPKSHRKLVEHVDSLQVEDEESAKRVSRELVALMADELQMSLPGKILGGMKPLKVIVIRSTVAALTKAGIDKIT